MLKPDVVFFGETVPRDVVDEARDRLAAALAAAERDESMAVPFRLRSDGVDGPEQPEKNPP